MENKEVPKTLTQDIKRWVVSSDKYHYLLESEEDYITQQVKEIAIELAREAYEAGNKYGYNSGRGYTVIPDQGTFDEWIKEKI